MPKKHKILRITFTQDYIVGMIDDERTMINGWTMEEVIEDWFRQYPLDSYHASRDGGRYRIGNSKKFIKSRVLDMNEVKNEYQKRNNEGK